MWVVQCKCMGKVRGMPPSAPRNHAIDVARALAVIGVVYNHSVDGLLAGGLLDPDGTAARLNAALYIFRMPALALLLGLFIPRAVAKRGATGYVRERVVFAVWLYLLWFFLQTGVEIATSSMKNNPTPPSALLEVWSMPAHLWFLPYLAVSALVISVAAPWLNRRRAALVLGGLAVLSLVVWDWNPAVFGLRGLSLLLFTAVGAALGMGRLGSWLNAPLWRWGAAGFGAVLAFWGLWQLGMGPGTAGSREMSYSTIAVSMTGALLGIVALLAAAAALSQVGAARRALGYVGQRTLEVYLAHVIVTAGTRIVLSRLGFDGEVLLLAVFIAGVIAPLVLAYVAPRVRCGWLFAPPAPLARWSRSVSREPATV